MSKSQIAILITRITLGAAMFLHGLQKVMSMAGTVKFFESLGLPSFLPYMVAAIEIGGGILMVLGILVPLVSLGFVSVLFGAIFTLKMGTSFVGGYELELILILLSIAVGIAHFEKKWFSFLPSKD